MARRLEGEGSKFGMNVCLVFPPNPVLQNPLLQPPLGILYIGAALEEAGHEVEVYDMRDKKLEDALPYIPPADFYGVTATTAEFLDAKAIAMELKEKYPDSVLVLGGAHASVAPGAGEFSDLARFDHVVIGEGERAMVDIVDGKAMPNYILGTEMDIDEYPFPARDLLPEDRIFSDELFYGTRYYKGEKKKSTSIISSRGCKYNCAFCGNGPHIRRAVRYRSPLNICAEVKELQDRWGCEGLRWDDDNMTNNKPRFLELCKHLKGFRMVHRAHTRSRLWDREMALAAREAGFVEMAFGVETADNDILAKLNKQETVEDHIWAINITKSAGMMAKVYLMVGLPFETWETIEKVKKFMREASPDKWTLSTFQPYPGCDIYEHPTSYGVNIINNDFSDWWLYSRSNIETTVASNKELNEHRRVLYEYLASDEWKK